MTLDRVAQVAGVSQATVSRVINGRPGSSAMTVRKVIRAVEKVGYVPKPPGRRQGMRRGTQQGVRTGNIAFIQVDDAYLQHTELACRLERGASQALAERGMNLIMACAGTSGHLPPAVLHGQVDGFLLAGGRVSPVVADRLRQFPAVWLTSRWNQEVGDQVLAGNDQVGRLAADYLLEVGCRRLVYVNPAPWSGVFRMRGVAFQVTAEHSRVPAEFLATPIDQEPLDGSPVSVGLLRTHLEALVPRLKALADGRTGVFVPDDMITAILYPLLHEAGVRPGRDLQLVSFGNQEAYLAGMFPRPATIDIAPETIGRRAVEQLLWRIDNPNKSRSVCLSIMPVVIEPNGTDRVESDLGSRAP